MDRRRFLATALAGGAAVLAGCSAGPVPAPQAAPTTTPRPTTTAPTPTTTPSPTFPAPQLTRVPIPPGRLTGLPGEGSLLAWTVDDGEDSSVVRAYTEFGRDTGTRLTFFLNGSLAAWTENADLLRPLVADGRIQLGNHTCSHPDLTSLSAVGVQDELQRNHDFVPALRPPSAVT